MPKSAFPGKHGVVAELRGKDGDEITLKELLSTAAGDDASAPVVAFLSYRSDKGTDQKYRLWYYYREASTGQFVPFTPDTSLSQVSLYVARVMKLSDIPVGASLGMIPTGQGAAKLMLGAGSVGSSELQDGSVTGAKLGTDVRARMGGAFDRVDRFIGDGSTTSFALEYSDVDSSEEGHAVLLGGLEQTLNDDYTVEEGQVVFSAAPESGMVVKVKYRRTTV
jgi:hypothetical protein